MSMPAWTLPYDRVYSENPPLGSCECIAEKQCFEPYMCPYTFTLEWVTLFPFRHLPLAVWSLMHRHGLKILVSKTIADGHKNAFWLTGDVPPKDCGKVVVVDRDSRVHAKSFFTQALCAGLATLHLQGDASTAEFATDNATPNFKAYAMCVGANGFVQLFFRFHGKLLQMTLDQVADENEDGALSPRIFLLDGSTASASFDQGQPAFPALKGRAWHPPYQLPRSA